MKSKPVRRRWYLDLHGIRRTGSKAEGFAYEQADGKPVRDSKTLTRIQRLRIPPAWEQVRIARSDRAPLQAVGVDKKGRTQYLYNPRFRQQREEEKFLRVVEFGEALPRLRRRVRHDLQLNDLSREHVLAAIVRLIDQGFFRVGNDKSAKSEETYGLTTVLSRHVRVSGDQVHFDFVGKWKKTHKRVVEDPQIASVVRRLRTFGDEELFKFRQNGRVYDVKDRHVNEYIQSIAGEKFTAKDFRTWAGTLISSVGLGMQGQAVTKKERKKRVKKAVESTALLLGNTPAVCRTSYICPRLLEEFMGGKPFEPARKNPRGQLVARNGHSPEEKALLKFLRETIADRRRVSRAA
jgi:DNA topoisomerase-1